MVQSSAAHCEMTQLATAADCQCKGGNLMQHVGLEFEITLRPKRRYNIAECKKL